MISAQTAWERLLPYLQPLSAEPCARRDAIGRVLAEPLTATVDVPAAHVSAMDGYAFEGEVTAGTQLPVVGRIAAGDAPGFELPPGSAVRIMTGAPLPAAADRVVPVELTDGGREVVEVHASPAAGEHVRRLGEILRAGDPLLGAGTLLTPGALALVATHGHGQVAVHRAPRVAVLPTGDEVVPPEQTPRPGQLRDSHTDFLLAAGAGMGLAFTSLGIAPDQPATLRELVRQGLEADVLLLCGGVSVGELDLVAGVLEELGCAVLFHQVAIQPAKPLMAAVHAGGLVFGLPGNPASAMVAFWLFVRPALRRLLGLHDHFWQGALRGELAAALPSARGRDRFLPAEVRFAEGRILVTPVAPKGSHDLAAYARGTGLVRVLAGSEALPPGATCEVLPLADWRAG